MQEGQLTPNVSCGPPGHRPEVVQSTTTAETNQPPKKHNKNIEVQLLVVETKAIRRGDLQRTMIRVTPNPATCGSAALDETISSFDKTGRMSRQHVLQ